MSAERLALFVGSWLPVSETFVYDQVQRQQRFEAHVFAQARTPDAATRYPYPHVTALTLPEQAGFFHLGLAPRFSHAMHALRPRVVHAHFGLNGALAAPLASAVGAPLVVSFHGHDVAGLFPGNRFSPRYFRYQRTADAMFDYASLLLCASTELAELLLERSPRLEPKIRVHRLGVDLTRFAPQARSPEPLRALMVGRLVEKKGMSYGLQAFARVHREHPDATLAIVGDGPLRAALQELVRTLELGESVRLLGALPHDGVRAAMQHANVLLAPSVVARDGDRESGVLVIKEAGACSLPTVATRHGGIPEIVEHAVTGWLVAERDVDGLTEGLRSLAADPALRRSLGDAARAKLEREYDTLRQNASLEALLASVA